MTEKTPVSCTAIQNEDCVIVQNLTINETSLDDRYNNHAVLENDNQLYMNDTNENEQNKDNLQNNELMNGRHAENIRALENPPYKGSIPYNIANHRPRQVECPLRKSSSTEFKHTRGQSQEFMDRNSTQNALQQTETNTEKLINNNENIICSQLEDFQEVEEKINDHSSVPRLLEPYCLGIRSRIELLGELLSCKKLQIVPDVYDEMKQIMEAIERNDRFQTDLDGKRLLALASVAKSNFNIDLYNLDIEIERQFGLFSVEVTGDGSCAFRAILISGMQQSDSYHSELRETAIQQVLKDMPYYSTVLKPGDRVNEEELKNWACSMADPNTYADEMANIAIADFCHIQLVIFRAGELLTVVNPRDGFIEYRAFLVNVGTHYKALVPRHELERGRQNSERLRKNCMLNCLNTTIILSLCIFL